MIMREKIKVTKKQIPDSSNSFIFRRSYIHSKIPTDYPQNPWGFITVPIPIPYPWESPYPRQPCKYHTNQSNRVLLTHNLFLLRQGAAF